MLFPRVYSFFLAGSFQFSFRGALPSAHFVYRSLCYPILSIFKSDFECNLFVLLGNSFCVFLSFRALILVGFLHLEAVFTSTCF